MNKGFKQQIFTILENLKNQSLSLEKSLIQLSEQVKVLQESKEWIQENNKQKVEVVFSTSFGIEDQVITDIICKNKLHNIKIFTLDTGRLFPETYQLWEQTEQLYQQKIQVFYPEKNNIEQYVNQNGINGFYQSIELRQKCCHIRKVIPLKEALNNAVIWITGLRSEQSQNRHQLTLSEWDENFQLYKFNPLIDWTTEQVISYLQINHIPFNTLYHKGFVSIGCAPCTRAILPNEDFRAGRWWWEDESHKECGLHRPRYSSSS